MEFSFIGIIVNIFLITISIICGHLQFEYVYDYEMSRQPKYWWLKLLQINGVGECTWWRKMDFKTIASDGDRGKRQKKELGQIA